jgi:transposase
MMTSPDRCVTGGFDTHADVNVGAVFDSRSRRVIGRASFPTTSAGNAAALEWLCRHGAVDAVGIESTGSYGAGLSRHLAAAGVKVVEVNRPEPIDRRFDGKDDYLDAEAAARAVLSGRAVAVPKSGDGPVEAIRALEIAYDSAMRDRTEAINQFKALLVRAPAEFRDRLAVLPFRHQLRTARRFRDTNNDVVVVELRHALKLLAQRIEFLEDQTASLEARMRPIIGEHFPALIGMHGCGVHSAAQLLMAAGDNPDRLHSDAAFAKLCAACPRPASSGKTTRYRLDRGGDRRANKALFRIVLVRMKTDDRTRAYVARRVAEGKSKREIIRCLKRFVAREVFNAITNPPPPLPNGPELRALRIAAGLSMEAVAIGAAVSYQRLSRIERGLEHTTHITTKAHTWITTMTT